MRLRFLVSATLSALIAFASLSAVLAQGTTQTRSETTPTQRLEVMRSRLDAMRRSLNSAIAAMNARDSGQNSSANDSLVRLRGLEQEVSSVLSEVMNLRGKVERSERIEVDQLDKLEVSITDLNTRVEAGLRATVSERSNTSASNTSTKKKKKKKFLGLFGGGGDDRIEELTGTVAPGRDRQLFEEATKEVRRGNHETGRLLFNTIITTYPDSPFLALSKLAIADSFYLEGTSSALIQAAAAYQDWLTFFPTDPLADDVMLKIAESEMRQMGLADRDTSRARKAEQRLKVLLQQFPNTTLKQDVLQRLNEVQENLAMHNLQVARFYVGRNNRGVGGLKGAQSRLREIVEKYPNFTYMDEVLFNLGALYVQEEEPDEAARYFQMIARDYPNSEFAEKAREQLQIIGAEVPPPDPIKKSLPPPVRPTMTQKLIREIIGTTPVTINKNGILISKDKDKDSSDLIDMAIANQGQLPATPDAVIQRRTRPTQQQQQQNTNSNTSTRTTNTNTTTP